MLFYLDFNLICPQFKRYPSLIFLCYSIIFVFFQRHSNAALYTHSNHAQQSQTDDKTHTSKQMRSQAHASIICFGVKWVLIKPAYIVYIYIYTLYAKGLLYGRGCTLDCADCAALWCCADCCTLCCAMALRCTVLHNALFGFDVI